MNKEQVIDAILATLSEEFERFQNASREARSEGNDDESRAEDQYDTRSTEANYLADGQARQAQQAMEAMEMIQEIRNRSFGKNAKIDLGALVKVSREGEEDWFYLAPAAGGVVAKVKNKEVTVITPASPIGSQLMGLQVGESTNMPKAEVLKVC